MRELTTDDILKAIKETNPLSRSKADVLKAMAEWAESNAINASVSTNGKEKDAGKPKSQGGRKLDL